MNNMGIFMTTVPPIKSQGIKTKLITWIKSVIPEDFDGLWIEPFMGTGVVAFNVAPQNALLCDTNPHLIRFYTAVQSGEITPSIVRAYLNREGAKLLACGQDHYYEIHRRFNETNEPLDFLFLSRAGFNGMMRFNQKGGFNIPFCRKPNRFAQAYVTKIVNQVAAISKILKMRDFNFVCQSFEETISQAENDSIIYCDPPYIGRHVDYYNGWDDKNENCLFDLLNTTNARFILSTWHHNDYRSNEYISSLWQRFHIMTRDHFYHVGGKEKNRNPMVEAVVTNFLPKSAESYDSHQYAQLRLLESKALYSV